MNMCIATVVCVCECVYVCQPSSFQVQNVEGVWKNLKMSYSMIDSTAVFKARAAQFPLLDRAAELHIRMILAFPNLATIFTGARAEGRSAGPWTSYYGHGGAPTHLFSPPPPISSLFFPFFSPPIFSPSYSSMFHLHSSSNPSPPPVSHSSLPFRSPTPPLLRVQSPQSRIFKLF
jgi:hypothetical protein